MSNKFVEKSPFTREGTASRAIYVALAKSDKPLTMAEISKRSKVLFKKTETLVRAYMNPFHNAPMRRAGIAIVQDKDGFKLTTCKAEPKAHRPERGNAKRKNKVSPKPKAAKKVTKEAAKKSPPKKMPTPASPAPVPVNESGIEKKEIGAK